MNIAIIGAGFTGLAASYRLKELGHDVTVYEQSDKPGGLASGFRNPAWDWPLENFYHHLFTSDNSIRELAQRVGHVINYSRPITSTYTGKDIMQLDSPLSLLAFTKLPLVDRLRTGIGIASLRYNPFWRPLQHITAQNYIQAVYGRKSWETLWEPLLVGKFGSYSGQISLAWFWARIKKRSSQLGYPKGGFLSLADSIAVAASKLGVKFYFNTSVQNISATPKNTLKLRLNGKFLEYDKIICTLPTGALHKLTTLTYPALPGLGATNLILELQEPFLPGGVYWLNINDRSFPFLSVVEHTNFIFPSHYGGHHLVYIGNYLSSDHKYFSYSPDKLLQIFAPFLTKLNPAFRSNRVINKWLFKSYFAQPIVTPGYQKLIPGFKTAIPNLYLANIQQVYPFDRGTNYAVELGYKVARLCINS